MINRLLQSLSVKDKNTISRCISIIENSHPDSKELVSRVFKKTGNAFRIGITGPPGAGKSTLTNQLTKHLRSEGNSVGIIAVDPTSPYTGGAVLGDRVRMNDIGLDEQVYIRSMASRGSLGGLSKKAIEAADVLDAAGFDFVLLETVGVGQSELDIARAADTTIVILVPESGDSVQAMKAGLMEIADLFVLNKADRPGAESSLTALRSILQLKTKSGGDRQPGLIKTIASENKGIRELYSEIINHKCYLENSGKLVEVRMHHLKLRVRGLLLAKFQEELWDKQASDLLNSRMDELINTYKSPVEISDEIYNYFVEKNVRLDG